MAFGGCPTLEMMSLILTPWSSIQLDMAPSTWRLGGGGGGGIHSMSLLFVLTQRH